MSGEANAGGRHIRAPVRCTDGGGQSMSSIECRIKRKYTEDTRVDVRRHPAAGARSSGVIFERQFVLGQTGSDD